ncbi:MAG: DUF4169 family protein [Pseudomonadota bacterium]
MSGDIVNLRQARKARARAEAKAAAEASSARHGRTKAARLAERATSDRSAAHLDAHKLDREADPKGALTPGEEDGA